MSCCTVYVQGIRYEFSLTNKIVSLFPLKPQAYNSNENSTPRKHFVLCVKSDFTCPMVVPFAQGNYMGCGQPDRVFFAVHKPKQRVNLWNSGNDCTAIRIALLTIYPIPNTR